MSNGNDDRFRSRKFLLACASLAIATLVLVVGEYGIYQLVKAKLIDATNYRLLAVAGLYWWLFCDLGVLGGYGIPNVIEKWSPRGGGG
jgi:hypothetical protein